MPPQAAGASARWCDSHRPGTIGGRSMACETQQSLAVDQEAAGCLRTVAGGGL